MLLGGPDAGKLSFNPFFQFVIRLLVGGRALFRRVCMFVGRCRFEFISHGMVLRCGQKRAMLAEVPDTGTKTAARLLKGPGK